MRARLILPVMTALLVAGCGGTEKPTAVAAPQSPTPSSTPSPTGDPACSLPELDKFLREIDAYTKRGAFEVEPKSRINPDKVFGWRLALGRVEGEAELKVYKAAVSAREAVQDWGSQDPGSLAQKISAMSIQLSAKTLAMTCHVHDRYRFSKL